MGSLQTQCGTPTYVAPEIIKHIPYGSKSDMWSLGVITYILIGGYPPFVEDDQRELFRKICNGDYEFHDKYFNCVSNNAKTLISSLLETNPKKRFSAKQALSHHWIRSDDETLLKNDLTTGNFQKLKQFNAKRKVRAAVHSLIAVNRLTSLLCGDMMIKMAP
jgi:calcium/calmodulin-dependent protein kinase I